MTTRCYNQNNSHLGKTTTLTYTLYVYTFTCWTRRVIICIIWVMICIIWYRAYKLNLTREAFFNEFSAFYSYSAQVKVVQYKLPVDIVASLFRSEMVDRWSDWSTDMCAIPLHFTRSYTVSRKKWGTHIMPHNSRKCRPVSILTPVVRLRGHRDII